MEFIVGDGDEDEKKGEYVKYAPHNPPPFLKAAF